MSDTRLGHFRVILLCTAAVVLLGACASPTVPLTARVPHRRPDLVGRSLALLPPIAFRGEGGPAAGWERATRTIWGSNLSGIDVIPVDRVRRVLEADRRAFETIRARVLRELPINDQPAAERRTLLKSKSIGGVDVGTKVWVTLRRSTGGLGIESATLPTEWLGRFGADYVLFSLSFRSAAQRTRTYALFGILPLFVRSEVEAQRPRGNLLLYDARTGELVWTAFVGGERNASSITRLPDSYWPAIAAAQLLTGSIDEAIVRLMKSAD